MLVFFKCKFRLVDFGIMYLNFLPSQLSLTAFTIENMSDAYFVPNTCLIPTSTDDVWRDIKATEEYEEIQIQYYQLF